MATWPHVALGVAVAMAAATIEVYAQVASHPFLEFDDALYITHNAVVQQGLGIDPALWSLTSADAHI